MIESTDDLVNAIRDYFRQTFEGLLMLGPHTLEGLFYHTALGGGYEETHIYTYEEVANHVALDLAEKTQWLESKPPSRIETDDDLILAAATLVTLDLFGGDFLWGGGRTGDSVTCVGVIARSPQGKLSYYGIRPSEPI